MKAILFFILLALNLPCEAQSSVRQKSISLNNKAIKVSRELGDRNKKLKQANLILDSAIRIDPTNLMPYTNKLNNLIALKEYESAIEVTNSALKVKPVLELLTAKGALLQKTGNLSEARQMYKKALNFGQNTYKLKPSSTLLCNLAVLHNLLEGKKKTLEFLNLEKANFANDPRGLKNIEAFEKILPNLTVDKILGIQANSTSPQMLRAMEL
ncbi:hypothetical protein WG904_11080 [Pedobacter sp. Du54]|uniref:hypothetical protein n=1 Tax=Pedobacter anseongensis TaxID=3133439 RepID=UPI0030B3F371